MKTMMMIIVTAISTFCHFFENRLRNPANQKPIPSRKTNESPQKLAKQPQYFSSESSLKLKKLQAEDRRLREWIRELAEQNVYLHREASSSRERELDATTKISLLDKKVMDLSIQVQEAVEENQYMQKSLSEIQEKYNAVEEERDCIRMNYEEKVIECKDMRQAICQYVQKYLPEIQEKYSAVEEERDCIRMNYAEKVNQCNDMNQVISRLQRTCNDQEKTIDGLRGLCEEAIFGEKNSLEHFDLQVEHMRLTGVEHALRKEVESYRAEVDSLQHENIDLINRLRKDGKEGCFSTFKLDRELENRVDCVQNQFLPLLMESSRISRKLFELVKTNGSEEGQVLIECDVKLQGLERAAKNITNSMRTVSSVLQEKPRLCHDSDNESPRKNEWKSEDMMKSAALKAETLLTSLLRDELYSKELELEQLQAEVAAAVRGNDILMCELQNAKDSCSCMNNEMKELELQMMSKDDRINEVQGEVEECKKELCVVRGTLTKVTEERDVMWEEVQQYSEMNMLLNFENKGLRKKIDDLDEYVLLKEGQITILKDSLVEPFDLETDFFVAQK